MVRLTSIYTKTGDDGTTGLGDGSRLPKHHKRIAAYGTVDELSSNLGLILAAELEDEDSLALLLREIQNDLFDLGADLSVPGAEGDKLRLQQSYVDRLEELIDQYNKELEPLRSFLLPGGNSLAARLHVARTICRRAERLVSELTFSETADHVNPRVLVYLNRLSDLLFVLARCANDNGRKDVLWKPGARQSDASGE